jgi:hypothetical protein
MKNGGILMATLAGIAAIFLLSKKSSGDYEPISPSRVHIGYVTWNCYNNSNWYSDGSLMKLTHVLAPAFCISSASNPTLYGMYGTLSTVYPDVVSKVAAFNAAHPTRTPIKVLPYLFTGSGYVNITQVISAGKLQQLCDNIRDLLITNDCDGVDLDIEAGESQATQDNFVTELYNTLDSDKIITMAMSSYATSVSTKVFNSYVSFGSVMCYDFWQKADQSPNMYPHSTYVDTIAAMQLRITQGYPKAKLVMGYPIYGYSTDGTNGRLASYHWHDVVAANPTLAADPANDYFVMGGYATWINNVNTVKQKAQWVVDNGLAGMMCFSVGYDDIGTTKSLMTAAWTVLDT